MKAAQARREGEDEDGASDTDTGEKKAPVEDAPQVAKHGGKEQAAPGSGSGSGGDRAEEQEGVAKEETKGQMNQRHKRYVVAVELAAVSFDDASGWQGAHHARSVDATPTLTLTLTLTLTGIPTTAVRQRP